MLFGRHSTLEIEPPCSGLHDGVVKTGYSLPLKFPDPPILMTADHWTNLFLRLLRLLRACNIIFMRKLYPILNPHNKEEVRSEKGKWFPETSRCCSGLFPWNSQVSDVSLFLINIQAVYPVLSWCTFLPGAMPQGVGGLRTVVTLKQFNVILYLIGPTVHSGERC